MAAERKKTITGVRERARKDSDAEIAKRRAELRALVAPVAESEAGREFLRYLRDYCGWEKKIEIPRADNTVGMGTLLHDAAVRNVYGHLRDLIPKKALVKIEMGDKK